MEVCVSIEVEVFPHGVAVLENRCRADFFMPWRNDSFAKVMYILGGCGRLCLEDRGILLGEEQLCIVPAGLRHRLVDDQEKPVWLLGLFLDQGNPAWSGVVGDFFEKPEVLTNLSLVQEGAMGLKRLLLEQSSIKAVAFKCGFESQLQFFRAFRQRKRTTPGQWRKGSGDRFDQCFFFVVALTSTNTMTLATIPQNPTSRSILRSAAKRVRMFSSPRKREPRGGNKNTVRIPAARPAMAPWRDPFLRYKISIVNGSS